MKVGDLVSFFDPLPRVLLGVVVDFDDEADGVLCFMFSKGGNVWFRRNQVKVVK